MTQIEHVIQRFRHFLTTRSPFAFLVLLLTLLFLLAFLDQTIRVLIGFDLLQWMRDSVADVVNHDPELQRAILSLLAARMLLVYGLVAAGGLGAWYYEYRLRAEKKTSALLAKTLERLERVSLAVIEQSQKIVAEARSTTEAAEFVDALKKREARRTAQATFERELAFCLRVGIRYAQGLFGPSVYRGGIVVPVANQPWLIHYASTLWDDDEERFQFYIKLDPANKIGFKSVAGTAYYTKTAQVCRWKKREKTFDHPDYVSTHVQPSDEATNKAFMVLPLQAEFLSLSEESDKRVLGVLCVDANQANAFDKHRLITSTTTHDVPLLSIMRQMFYLLKWRDQYLSSMVTADDAHSP